MRGRVPLGRNRNVPASKKCPPRAEKFPKGAAARRLIAKEAVATQSQNLQHIQQTTRFTYASIYTCSHVSAAARPRPWTATCTTLAAAPSTALSWLTDRRPDRRGRDRPARPRPARPANWRKLRPGPHSLTASSTLTQCYRDNNLGIGPGFCVSQIRLASAGYHPETAKLLCPALSQGPKQVCPGQKSVPRKSISRRTCTPSARGARWALKAADTVKATRPRSVEHTAYP